MYRQETAGMEKPPDSGRTRTAAGGYRGRLRPRTGLSAGAGRCARSSTSTKHSVRGCFCPVSPLAVVWLRSCVSPERMTKVSWFDLSL